MSRSVYSLFTYNAIPTKAGGWESQCLILPLFVSYIDEVSFDLPTQKDLEALAAREQSPGHFAHDKNALYRCAPTLIPFR